ncbi:hypothetical protein ACJX0J_008919, partial [Zea mays]
MLTTSVPNLNITNIVWHTTQATKQQFTSVPHLKWMEECIFIRFTWREIVYWPNETVGDIYEHIKILFSHIFLYIKHFKKRKGLYSKIKWYFFVRHHGAKAEIARRFYLKFAKKELGYYGDKPLAAGVPDDCEGFTKNINVFIWTRPKCEMGEAAENCYKAFNIVGNYLIKEDESIVMNALSFEYLDYSKI